MRRTVSLVRMTATDPADPAMTSTVTSDVEDVLAGWDPDGPPPVLDGRAPFPTDTVIAVGATVAGVVLGLARGGRHPIVRAKLGGLLGLGTAIVARRMWRLPG